MTPKEKADELVNKFSIHTDMINNIGAVDHELWKKRAINYAKMAVEEIRTEYSSYRIKHWVSLKSALEMKEYWDDVLETLNAL